MTDDNGIVPISFDDKFVNDYASRLVNDPEVAIVELVSNCSDAGANNVEIEWPPEQYGDFRIKDDGTGMTYDEFVNIWNTLSYNRRDRGNGIVFPEQNIEGNRKLFGKNGKGRFSLFCFNDDYTVETNKGGKQCLFKVRRLAGRRLAPIQIEFLEPKEEEKMAHGTVISSCAFNKHIEVDRLRDLIGCKFLADPSLKICVNGTPIELTNLNGADRETVETDLGDIDMYILDSGKGGRTSHPHGVAWHVNGKGVGNVDWRDPNRMYTLDARTAEAKRITFIVVADVLEEYVTPDWTAFVDCDEINEIFQLVSQHIQAKLDELFYRKRQERKQVAMAENREELKKLSKSAQKRIEKYVDGIQTEVRTIDQKTLNAAVKLLTTLEGVSAGYELLSQLADVQPDDVPRLNSILTNWSIRDAEIVLNELGLRLKLIEKLVEVVDDDVDELQVIHPLIEQGLWIFGPEYEGISYTSNRALITVLRKLLKNKVAKVDRELRRPDFVVLPDESILRTFSRDSYGENHEVNGLASVLIIELKGGGDEIAVENMQQVEGYAHAVAQSGNLSPTAKINCLVLGSTLGENTSLRKIGIRDEIVIEARTYQTIIRQAKARTFHLKKKIEEAKLNI